MRRIVLAVAGMLAMSVAVKAQEYPKVEVFGGYSHGNFDAPELGGSRTNVNGWNASAAVNLNNWFGVASEVSGHYGDFHASVPIQPLPCTPPNCAIETSGTNKYHDFLFGPQFTLRRARISPFAHFLFGVSHVNESGTITIPGVMPPPPIPLTFHFSESTNNLAFAAGGGADFKLSQRIAWRVQTDYLVTQISNRTQNDLRVSTGLVFRF